jgi:hypothetical protein
MLTRIWNGYAIPSKFTISPGIMTTTWTAERLNRRVAWARWNLARVVVTLSLAVGCSSEDPPAQSCQACDRDYTSCSFDGNPEALEFHIERRYAGGCSGSVMGAAMHLSCQPLQFCWYNGQCSPVTYESGTLNWTSSLNKCE